MPYCFCRVLLDKVRQLLLAFCGLGREIFWSTQSSFSSYNSPSSAMSPNCLDPSPTKVAINKHLSSLNYFVSLRLQVNFYLTSSCLKRQKRPRARHEVAIPVPLCVNSPGRVSTNMALFGFRKSRNFFCCFLRPFITRASVAVDIILLVPDFSSRNLTLTLLFREVHFFEKSITYQRVGKRKYAIWLSTPPVYKYRIAKSWGRIVNEMAKRYRFNFSYFFLKAEKPAIHASFRCHLTHTLSLSSCSFFKILCFPFLFPLLNCL